MLKSQEDMNQLNEKITLDKRVKEELDIQKKVNHLGKELKRIKDLVVVIVVR